jgi:hypothetical protein
MPIKKTIVFGLVFLLLVPAYFLIGTFSASESNGLSSKSVELIESSMVGETTVIITNPAIAKLNFPLPPADLQVVANYDELKQRADAGNSKAACRLALDLSRCAVNKPTYEALKRERAKNPNSNPSKDLDLASQQATDKYILNVLTVGQLCEGVTDAQFKQRSKYLRQAAYAGIPVAMVNYASNGSFENTQALLQDASYDLWKKDAINMTQRALAMGVPEAALMFQNAYADDYGSLFSGLVPNDPVKAEVYRLLNMRLLNETAEKNDSLTQKEIDYATAESDRMFTQYFQNQPRKQDFNLLYYFGSEENQSDSPDNIQKPGCE